VLKNKREREKKVSSVKKTKTRCFSFCLLKNNWCSNNVQIL
jgi:hypothetical protein